MRDSRSVLIVDDEPGIRELAARTFKAAGFMTHCALNGAEAIKILNLFEIDLVLIDIIMPDREGIETILEIKKHWPHCKIVAMSGGGRIGAETFLDLALRVGADGVLKKPIRFPHMVEMASNLLDVATVS